MTSSHVYVCVCVRVCVKESMRVCVCVRHRKSVCVREKEKEFLLWKHK